MLVEKLLPVIRARLTCITPQAALLEAARLLDGERDIVLVCTPGEDRLVGIVTKTDVVRMTGRCAGASCTAPIEAAMTRDVVTTTPGAWLNEAWQVMRERGLKNLPVLDGNGAALGVLNARDALQTLLQEVRHEEELLRDYAMSLGYR
ncbi:CBS domain-containing protein [Maritimibacter fusiformis]|uniref:CBS domain-containing protein n=1 Tax=Maritimibacter fusiformis TaxID=2603819 RepID=A0A5D0RHY8_9RHOB|nr:CBS domain-containing protein [Maritimibacter fusiformis]TYB81132.1 CBS domain-containing protein [Maritimibacter fusiformis]